jgi:hypothetical protein
MQDVDGFRTFLHALSYNHVQQATQHLPLTFHWKRLFYVTFFICLRYNGLSGHGKPKKQIVQLLTKVWSAASKWEFYTISRKFSRSIILLAKPVPLWSYTLDFLICINPWIRTPWKMGVMNLSPVISRKNLSSRPHDVYRLAIHWKWWSYVTFFFVYARIIIP